MPNCDPTRARLGDIGNHRRQLRARNTRHRAGNTLFFHELATKWPGAAAQCVHWTFRRTLTALFSVAEPASHRPGRQHVDGIPARCEPGLLGYVAGYLGIVEPQMRLTEHLHMLVQILGFTSPQHLFGAGAFLDTFRRTWAYFASVCFTSEEAFAVYLRCPEALAALREAPLMQVTPKPRHCIMRVTSDPMVLDLHNRCNLNQQ